ncbi:uncharacterized protein I303_107015 [Kwoniella dejecticola CBS 10117]|uniref:L-serine ammonia-lyase n=1 Tax=Kwoniella dejecticola CBS 10117 TaxID=1296121 RepID=A0A1A5ZYH8_9TREE|nr:uncharacterized protein I303_06416 [Kwoniella dejecticola CBS 10117]OBR82859.1 hypothetical protein I303_06416 [Kwoniella dejecticola CBS 10117]
MPETTPSRPWIETPLLESKSLSKLNGCRVFQKLENLQPSKSFKTRGIGNLIVQSIKADPSRTPHFYISSGGNAGLACVTASSTLGYKSTVVVPQLIKPFMVTKLETAGAEVIQHGATWFECDQYLRNELLDKDPNGVYIPPFDHPEIWQGASSMVEEWERQLAVIDGVAPLQGQKNGQSEERIAADAVVCSVGGGGLFCGIMKGLESKQNKTKVVTVETIGCDSLYQSVEKGELVTLPGITSIATSLGATRVAPQALQYTTENKDTVKSLTVTDKQAVEALLKFASEENMIVEPACGATLAPAYEGRLKEIIPDLKEDSRVILVVCGGSVVNLELLDEWRRTYGS